MWWPGAPHWHRAAHGQRTGQRRAGKGLWAVPAPAFHMCWAHSCAGRRWALWGIQIIGDCLPKFANSKFHCQDIVEAFHVVVSSNLVGGRGETPQGKCPPRKCSLRSVFQGLFHAPQSRGAHGAAPPTPPPRPPHPRPAPQRREESSGVSPSCACGIAGWPSSQLRIFYHWVRDRHLSGM